MSINWDYQENDEQYEEDEEEGMSMVDIAAASMEKIAEKRYRTGCYDDVHKPKNSRRSTE